MTPKPEQTVVQGLCHRPLIHDANRKVMTLAEALAEPRPHREDVHQEPMTNFKSTPDNPPHELPLSFWASWELNSRPRRIALLCDDCQEEYRPYAQDILKNLETLTTTFRSVRDQHIHQGGGVCVVWSVWSRTFDDGIHCAMDRWYGPRGLRPETPENAVYVFTGHEGLKPLKEIEPTPEEVADGWCYYGRHLDMFWNFRSDGKSYLDEKLKEQGIDTVVISGLWTDECILSTAYAALSRGYDVVVVGDAVGTATANGQKALDIVNGTCGKVLTTQQVVDYMKNEFKLGEVGAVKGTSHPDGRKDPH
mmetsp:Transcript_28076/g.52693  ORF Transcript_28076/g.52693 Transcript_28076/m.52693 type:complete len:307 (+) Transcript_28076:275-1195(+)|eukprot:CAMPEP_0178743552 /NCGR_PEP_ID=MMETSP0744-20121128/6267_1 /TAXON_ID=913974 /ORGANISM="Nitzschia punctata, Strain CCMP561" /LENGTH=306 /DNA_ID=CAMNT_0020396565 /DNA_START=338 /DNA_END=1258 /DNA_ORIENTATION=-